MKKTFFYLTVLILVMAVIAFAQAETITITTYYPAPYGAYEDLSVSGTLGVGVNPAQATLHVLGPDITGDSISTDFILGRTGMGINIGDGSRMIFDPQNSANPLAAIGEVTTLQQGNLFFSTFKSGATSEKMRITGDGNVGIGTNSPNRKLVVKGDDASFGLLSNDNSYQWDFVNNPSWGLGSFHIWSRNPDAARLSIKNNGSIGIGTTNPNDSALLELNSNSQGLLLPRMTTDEKNAISSPLAGLTVFDSDLGEVQYYNGSAWVGLGGGPGSWACTVRTGTASGNGAWVTATASCSGSEKVITGGCSGGEGYVVTVSNRLQVPREYPTASPQGWACYAYTALGGSSTVTAYAQCCQ